MKKTGEGRDEGDLHEVSDSDREAGGGRFGEGRGTGVELTDEGWVLKRDETAFAQRPPGRMMRAYHVFQHHFLSPWFSHYAPVPKPSQLDRQSQPSDVPQDAR